MPLPLSQGRIISSELQFNDLFRFPRPRLVVQRLNITLEVLGVARRRRLPLCNNLDYSGNTTSTASYHTLKGVGGVKLSPPQCPAEMSTHPITCQSQMSLMCQTVNSFKLSI